MSNIRVPNVDYSKVPTGSTSTAPKTDWTGLGLNIFNTGLGWFSAQENRKSAEKQAQALRDKGLSDIEVARLMLEGKKLELEGIKAGAGKDSSINPKLLIGLGVGGVLVLGIVIFAVLRKKT